MAVKNHSPLLSQEFEIFLALADNRSFTKTAEKLGMSVPSVSRIINTLESQLKIQLFDRTIKPVALTPEGRWLLSELRPHLLSVQNIIDTVEKAVNLKPYLRIGFIDSFSYEVAPHFISEIEKRLSGISCLTGGADRLVERLYAQEVDLILSIDPCFDIPDVRRHTVLEEPSVLIFPASKVGRRASFESWRDISFCDLPFIHSYGVSGGGKLENDYFTTNDISFYGTIHSDSIGMRMKLVAQGKGWAIIRPISLLQHEELIPRLCIVKVPEPGFMRKVYAVARSSVSKELFEDVVQTLEKSINTCLIPKLDFIPESIKKQIRTNPEG